MKFKTTKTPEMVSGVFAFSYEGGDSEFFNYLGYIIILNCVQNVFRLL